jgi:predicted nucleic-acid-binding protein
MASHSGQLCTPCRRWLGLLSVEAVELQKLSFRGEAALQLALAQYRDSGANFADCVHVALSGMAGEQPLWTFDRAASKVTGARLLT